MASLRLLLLIGFPALLGSGCAASSDDDDDSSGDAAVPDGGLQDADLPDAADSSVDSGIPCERDEECSDGIDCTVDRCSPRTSTCSVAPNDTLCINEDFCDGEERCSPTEGCVPGPSRSCSDNDVCTIDECDEATDECVHRGRDFDRDGHVDWHCKLGDDCDDDEPRVHGGAPEICGDLLDNNCNGVNETGENCLNPGFDTCDSPLDVGGGGAFPLSLAGTVGDYAGTCGFGVTNDAVLRFTLRQAQDVEITVENDNVRTAAILQRTECGVERAEVECAAGLPAHLRARALPAGTYFIIVQAERPVEVLAVVEFNPPSPPPANERCGGAIDVSAGGRFNGSFVDVANDHPVSCGFDDPELVYRFTLDQVSDVDLTATSGFISIPMAVSTTCGNAGTELRCSYAAPSQQHLYRLAAGTYFVLVEGSSEFDFTLDVDIGPPSDPPPGDLCGSAVDVSNGGQFEGSLVGRQDDVEISCGLAQADTMFLMDLAEEKDVTLRAEGDGGEWMSVAIQETCDDVGSEASCRFGNPASSRTRRLPAGSYTVVVEAGVPTDFTLDVTIEDAAPATTVDVAETCDDAVDAPAIGGLFQGDTTDANDDHASTCGGNARGPDEVIHLELLGAARVTASLDPEGFDGVLHVHEGRCLGAGDEVFCQDESGIGDTSLYEANLEPGSYFFVVDGVTVNDYGPWLLDLLVIFDN